MFESIYKENEASYSNWVHDILGSMSSIIPHGGVGRGNIMTRTCQRQGSQVSSCEFVEVAALSVLLVVILHVLRALGLCLGGVPVQDVTIVGPRLGLNIPGDSACCPKLTLVEAARVAVEVTVGVGGSISLG